MSAFYIMSGTVRFKPGTDLDELLPVVREDLRWMETFSEMVTEEEAYIEYQFDVCGDSSYGWGSDIVSEFEDLKDHIIEGEIYETCDDDRTKYTWDPEKQEFEPIGGQVCFSADEAETYFPRPIPYKELLSMFQDYVYNDVAAAELDYVRNALAAVGVDKHNAKYLGLDYIYDDEEDE